MKADCAAIMKNIFQEVQDINNDYIYDCRIYIDKELAKKNTDISTYLQVDSNKHDLNIMVFSWITDCMTDNQINKFLIKYGIHNALKHFLDKNKDSMAIDEDTTCNHIFSDEIENMIEINHSDWCVLTHMITTSIFYEAIKDMKEVPEYHNRRYNHHRYDDDDTKLSLYSLGYDNLSLIYDEYMGINKDYVKDFYSHFSSKFNHRKCSQKGSDYVHTERCHQFAVDITFEYLKKYNTDDINQIIIKYGIGNAITLFYEFYKSHSKEYYSDVIGKRIRNMIKWKNVLWNVELEMVFLIFMKEVYDHYTFE